MALREIEQLLLDASAVEIVTHVRGDTDSASAFALAAVLDKLGKDAFVLHDIGAHLRWLIPEGRFSGPSVPGALRLAIDTANFARLALPADARKQIEALVTEHGREDRVPSARWQQLYAVDAVVDHHVTNRGYGSVNWIDPKASSVSEMLTIIVQDLERETGMSLFDDDICSRLYAGIVTDTNWFMRDTTQRTYEAAGFLDSRALIDKEGLAGKVNSRSFGYFSLGAQLRQNATHRGEVVTSWLDRAAMDRFGVDPDEAALMIEDLERLPGRIFLLFVEVEAGEYRVRLRGRDVPIHALARTFGGGGHEFRAGATVRSLSEMEALIEAAHATLTSALGASGQSQPLIEKGADVL